MNSTGNRLFHIALALSGLLTLATPSPAQQPSQAQISAIRSACRGDYMANCSGVPTGGKAALQCLQQHAGLVSAGCRSALAPLSETPATTQAAVPSPAAAAPAAQAQLTPPGAALVAQADATSAWPHTISRDGASVTVYQPQAIEWPGRQTLTARAAVAVTPPGQSKAILGTIELTVATHIDDATGTVQLSDPKLLETHFPSLDTQHAQTLDEKMRSALPQMEIRAVPLTAVLLSLKQEPVAAVAVNNDPPVIFNATGPASLVVFDGEPVLAPVGQTGLRIAVNTNWDVFVDQSTWYLLNNGVWFSAPQPSGPYAPTAQLPAAFNNLPKDANFADVRKAIPARLPSPEYKAPRIFVSTKPAEIVVTDGAPSLKPVAGTGLQRVVNTPSVLFFDPSQASFYLQLSGRWFSAHGLAGPWEYATDKLPPDFAFIPRNGPDAAVLASVPGTVQAQEAVLQAQIPTTATFQRSAAKLTVVYSGPPHFEPIPGTTILAAVNTNVQVLHVGDGYYACDTGVWFVSKAPTGPWVLADNIPPVIRSIPPTSPYYNLTYVQIYAVTADAVTYGYTAGYALGYVNAGVLVYGTGYYYPPVVIPGPVPIFYPYPYTYAGSVWYNSSAGAWAHGGTIYGPYGGGATHGTYYNPNTGAWAHGGAIYGPNGGAGAWSAYNPSTGSYAHGSASWSNGSGSANASYYNARTGVSGSTSQNWNPNGRSGSSTFSGPNQTVNTRSGSNANGRAGGFSSSTGAEGAGYHNNITGNSGHVVKTQNGDVYAGHDGNVYQHNDNGWSKYNNGSWNPVQPPSRNTTNTPSNNTRQGATQTTQSATRGNSMDRGNYQQLEQDRLGRQASGGGWGGSRGGGGGWRGARGGGGGWGGRRR
jgi:hypothetical protein